MSRGRKRNSNVLAVDWLETFKKNVGLYLDVICRSRSCNDEMISDFEKLKEISKKAKDKFLENKQVRLNSAKPKDEILEMRYAIPSHWNWFLLSDVAFYQEGPGIRSFQYKTEGIKLLNVQNITPDKLQLDLTSRYISSEEYRSKYKHFKVEQGDILFASSGGSWGKTCWFEDPGYDLVLNTSTMRLRTFSESVLANDFLYLFLKTDFFRKQLIVQLSGMQPNFGSTHLNSVSIPLPPLNEQKKILTFLYDLGNNSLSSHEYFEIKVEKKLVALQVAQLKCSEILNEIANQNKCIGLLRQTILQEAVQGKLTKQDANDEPASELLKRIKAEKQKLIKEGKLKKEKELSPIAEDEIPFELPKGWVWCRLGEIIKISSGDGLTANQMSKNGAIPVYGGNGINGYHDRFNVSTRTIVIGRVGFYCGSIHYTEEKAWVTDNAFITDFSKENINAEFLVLLLKATNLKQDNSGTAQPVISGRKVYPLVVAFPPLPEQQRIVTKVQQLQQQLNALETQVQQSRQYAQQLLQAVLKEAFEVNKENYATNEQLTMAAEE